jgi:hypothetical protein
MPFQSRRICGIADIPLTGNDSCMTLSKRKLAIACIVLWESYWAYTYMTASVPDEDMSTVAAILFGGIIPLALLVLCGSALLVFRAWINQRW